MIFYFIKVKAVFKLGGELRFVIDYVIAPQVGCSFF